MRRVTRKAFGEWLSRFDDDIVVGYTGVPMECPVANFFGEIHGVKADVIPSEVMFGNSRGQHVEVKNPRWAARFIREIDNSTERMDMPVTAAQAKGVFNRCINYNREFTVA